MNKLWYQDYSILFNNLEQFFPDKNQSSIEKINALARFALYYAIIIIILNKNKKYLSISFVIFIITLLFGSVENFTEETKNIKKKENKNKCYKPTADNPFMNFTLNDYYDNPKRPAACKIDSNINKSIKHHFFKNILPDTTDLWGIKSISDRQFYTMPSTEIVNDQKGFATWLYNDIGKCKSKNENCLKYRDNKYHHSRIYKKDNI